MKVQNISVDDTCIIQHGGSFKAIFPGDVVELEESEAYAALKQHSAFLKEFKGVSGPKTKIEPEVK